MTTQLRETRAGRPTRVMGRTRQTGNGAWPGDVGEAPGGIAGQYPQHTTPVARRRGSLFGVLCLVSMACWIACPGCGAGGAGGGGGDGPPLPPAADVTGTWTMRSQGIADCGRAGETTTFTAEVTQTGNDIELYAPEYDAVLAGTISGSKINVSGSYWEDGGVTTVQRTDITIAAGGTALSGTWVFRWVSDFDPSQTCGGTGGVSGTKLD